jgi:hypothetical protein
MPEQIAEGGTAELLISDKERKMMDYLLYSDMYVYLDLDQVISCSPSLPAWHEGSERRT